MIAALTQYGEKEVIMGFKQEERYEFRGSNGKVGSRVYRITNKGYCGIVYGTNITIEGQYYLVRYYNSSEYAILKKQHLFGYLYVIEIGDYDCLKSIFYTLNCS